MALQILAMPWAGELTNWLYFTEKMDSLFLRNRSSFPRRRRTKPIIRINYLFPLLVSNAKNMISGVISMNHSPTEQQLNYELSSLDLTICLERQILNFLIQKKIDFKRRRVASSSRVSKNC